MADDGHAVVGDDDLAGHGQLAVAAVGRGHVDDDAARAHGADVVGGEQARGLAAGDVRGGDDDVGGGRLLGVELRGGGGLVVGHFLGVAVGGLLRGDGDGDELGAHGLDLLARFGAQVGGLDDGAHGVGGADGGEAADAGADDVHGGRRDLARGGDLASEQAAEGIGGLDHGAVAGDVGHRGQHVHRLRARQARHGVHRECGEVRGREVVDKLRIAARGQSGDEHRAGLHQVAVLARRGVEGGDDVRAPHILADESCAGGYVKIVGVGGMVAGPGLDVDVVAELDQLGDRVRRRRDERLPGIRFNGDSDSHCGLLNVLAGRKSGRSAEPDVGTGGTRCSAVSGVLIKR